MFRKRLLQCLAVVCSFLVLPLCVHASIDSIGTEDYDGTSKSYNGSLSYNDSQVDTMKGGNVFGTLNVHVPSTYVVTLPTSLTLTPAAKADRGVVKCTGEYTVRVTGDIDPAYYVEVKPSRNQSINGTDITAVQEKTRFVSSYYVAEGAASTFANNIDDSVYVAMSPNAANDTAGTAETTGTLTANVPQSMSNVDYNGEFVFVINYDKIP